MAKNKYQFTMPKKTTTDLNEMFKEPEKEPEVPVVDEIIELSDKQLREIADNAEKINGEPEKFVRPGFSIAENRTLMTGGQLPPAVPKEGANPLLVESLSMFEKLLAGGVIFPWARLAQDDVAELIKRLRSEVEGK